MVVKMSPQAENRFLKDRYCVLQSSLSFIQRRHSWLSRLAYGWRSRHCLTMVLTDTMLFCPWSGRFLLKKRTLLTSLLPYHSVAWEVAHSGSSEKIWWVKKDWVSTYSTGDTSTDLPYERPAHLLSFPWKGRGRAAKLTEDFKKTGCWPCQWPWTVSVASPLASPLTTDPVGAFQSPCFTFSPSNSQSSTFQLSSQCQFYSLFESGSKSDSILLLRW